MTQLLVHHKVADYGKWRDVFDSFEAKRKEHGSQGARVLRSASDPNEIVVIDQYPSLEQARAWAQSPTLREAMKEAGVTSQPEVLFLDEA